MFGLFQIAHIKNMDALTKLAVGQYLYDSYSQFQLTSNMDSVADHTLQYKVYGDHTTSCVASLHLYRSGASY